MKKVNYKEIINLLNSSDIEIVKLGISYLLDLNFIDKETFQNIIEKYDTQIWDADYDLDLIIWNLRETIPEFDKYIIKGGYPTSGKISTGMLWKHLK